MDRFIGYRIYMGILLAAMAVCGACREETVCNETVEGENAVIRLEVRAQEQVQVGTRATPDEILNEKENKISNLHVLIYDAGGELIGQKYQATAGTVTVNTRSARGCTIYAIANTGDPELFKGYDIHRESTLKDMVRTVPHANTLTNGTTLPMTGSMKNVNITPGTNSLGTLELTRMAARIELDIKAKEGSGIKIGSYIICNIPFREYYIARPMNTEPNREDAPAGSDEPGGDDAGKTDINAHWTNTPEVTLAGGSTSVNKVFYMFENRRGTKGRIEHQKDKNTITAPKRATYVYVKGKVGEVTVIWRVFLGANNTSNFNIKRNCRYKYQIILNDAAVTDTRVDIDFANTINLSTPGTANCYLASKTCTWYKFKATVRGNGAATAAEISPTGSALPANAAINPATAELVWETGGHGKIIQAVMLKEGYVYFKTGPTEEGNAVIAVKDATGNIIWSWHIWKMNLSLEEMNAGHTQTYRTNPRSGMNPALYFNGLSPRSLVMMDRNLGAADNTPSNTDEVTRTYGLYYQFGRKDPFPSAKNRTGDVSRVDYYQSIDVFNKNGDKLDTEALKGNNYQIKNSSIPGGTGIANTITYSISHPLTFILHDDADAAPLTGIPSYNWLYDANPQTPVWKASNKLWGSDLNNENSLQLDTKFTQKTIYDPCPHGWCVPPPDTWTNFTTTTATEGDYNTDNPTYYNSPNEDKQNWSINPQMGFMSAPVFGRRFYINGRSGETAFYPAEGYRYGGNGDQYNVGYYCSVWSSAPSQYNYPFATFAYIYTDAVTIIGTGMRSAGYPLRCVQEASVNR